MSDTVCAQSASQKVTSSWMTAHPFVGVLDFGSQYTQLIARRLREMGVYTRVFPATVSAAHLGSLPLRGLIFSGGPETASQENALKPDAQVYQLGVPLLGICYGMQLMALQFGGQVQSAQGREFGRATLRCTPPAVEAVETKKTMAGKEGDPSAHFPGLLSSLESETTTVWMSHGDSVSHLPAGFICTASTEAVAIIAMEDTARGYYGVQFHPEVTHTPEGGALLSHFALQICGCVPDWTAENKKGALIADVQEKVQKDRVVLGLSGGVDSSVTAALLSLPPYQAHQSCLFYALFCCVLLA